MQPSCSVAVTVQKCKSKSAKGTLQVHCMDTVYLQCMVICITYILATSLKYTACTLPEHCSVQAVYTADCSVHYNYKYYKHCLYTAGGTLHIHFSLCSVVAVYTAQSLQSMCSHTLLVHCSYSACTLHFGLGIV